MKVHTLVSQSNRGDVMYVFSTPARAKGEPAY